MPSSVLRTHVSVCALLCLALAPIPAAAEHTPAHTVTITSGNLVWPVGNDLTTQPVKPEAGSLTAPSLNKTRQSLSRIPGGVDLVPAEAYQDRYALTFKDMLRTVPGVFAEPRYGEEVRLSIRGSGIGRGFHLRGIQLLQDGVPLNFADGSGDFQEVDPLISRAVEVYKGGNGLQFGAASLGGAINITTPTGITAPARHLLRLEGGSDETWRTHGSVARAFNGGDFYGAATGITSSGARAQSNQKTGRVSGTIGLKLTETAETRFFLALQNINQEVPGTLSLQAALNDPGSAPALNRANNYSRDIRALRLANKTTFRLSDTQTLDAGIFMTARNLYHPIFQVVDQDWFQTGAFTRLDGSTTMAGLANRYTLGGTVSWGTIDAEQYVNTGGSRGAKTADSRQDATQYALYGENQLYVLSDLAVVVGARILRAERTFTNNLNAAANASRDYETFSPKIGLLWDAAPGAQIFANLSRSVEPPTFAELVQTGVTGFVPLAAQRAWTVEVGTRGQRQRIGWDISAYHAAVKGELLNFTTAPGIPAATFNAADTVHQGIELGVDLEVGKGWLWSPDHSDSLVFRQVYTLSRFFFDDDRQYGDNTLAGIPAHVWYGELVYRHAASGFSLTPNVTWIPEGAHVDYANTLQAPGYTVVGMRAALDVAPGVNLFFDGRNLLDERSVSSFSTITDARTANTHVFYPGEGRGIFAGVSLRF
jgi:iron complex outermembrane receptor protein